MQVRVRASLRVRVRVSVRVSVTRVAVCFTGTAWRDVLAGNPPGE